MKITITDQDNITYDIADSSKELSCLGSEERMALDHAKQLSSGAYQSAYQELHRKGDNLEIPDLLVSDSPEFNFIAANINKTNEYLQPVICYGLVGQLQEEIIRRYPDESNAIQNSAFEYGIKFLALHELFHLWHGHNRWETNYYFVGEDQIKQGDGRALYLQYKPLVFSLNDNDKELIRKNEEKFLLVANYHRSHQALEADADRAAIKLLINDILNGLAGKNIQEKKAYVGLCCTGLITAVLTVNNIFHHNRHRKYTFASLPRDMAEIDHPIPAIRFYMVQNVIFTAVEKQIKDRVIRQIAIDRMAKVIEDEYKICERAGEKYPFFALAYCNIGQRHVLNLRMRYNQILPTLQQCANCRLEKAYSACDFKIQTEDIRYSDSGEIL